MPAQYDIAAFAAHYSGVSSDSAPSDSALITASVHYVTDSDRKSGKTNKKNGNGNGQPHP